MIIASTAGESPSSSVCGGGAATLDCPAGLILRGYAPEASGAHVITLEENVDIRVTPPLLMITKIMVERASITKYFEFESERESIEGAPNRTFYGVQLELAGPASERVRMALDGRNGQDLVLECGSLALIGGVIDEKGRLSISVVVTGGRDVAIRFARSASEIVQLDLEVEQ